MNSLNQLSLHVNNMNSKLDKLEAIRGLAALYVVFHHSFFSEHFMVANKDFSFLFKFGQEAVILFFLMSGFVIGYSFQRSKDKSFLSYFQKRFYRIYIPLICVLLTHFVIKCFASGALIDPQWKNLFGNMLMLQDVSSLKPNVILDPYLGNSPLWSLSYEWWFYMSFFLIYTAFSKVRYSALIVPLLVIFSAISYIWHPFFVNRLFMYYGIWWAGVIMAESFMKYNRVRIQDMKIPLLTLILTVIILSINGYLNSAKITTIGISPLLELRHFGFAIVAIAGALIWQEIRWFYFDKLLGRFKVLAPVSYVLYICHYFLVARATYLDVIGNKYIEFFVYLAIAVFYSYLIEVQLYPWAKNKLVARKKEKGLGISQRILDAG